MLRSEHSTNIFKKNGAKIGTGRGSVTSQCPLYRETSDCCSLTLSELSPMASCNSYGCLDRVRNHEEGVTHSIQALFCIRMAEGPEGPGGQHLTSITGGLLYNVDLREEVLNGTCKVGMPILYKTGSVRVWPLAMFNKLKVAFDTGNFYLSAPLTSILSVIGFLPLSLLLSALSTLPSTLCSPLSALCLLRSALRSQNSPSHLHSSAQLICFLLLLLCFLLLLTFFPLPSTLPCPLCSHLFYLS